MKRQGSDARALGKRCQGSREAMPGLSGSGGPFQVSRGRYVPTPVLGTTTGSGKERLPALRFQDCRREGDAACPRHRCVPATPTPWQGQGYSYRDVTLHD